jgi:S1-C subfamily serine protease
LVLGITAAAVAMRPSAAENDALGDAQEKAVKDAVKNVEKSVVQIETQGGTEIIASGPKGPRVRKGVGPTTGVVVGADGFVISSAFNFANKPTAITVRVPGHKEGYVAEVVATDQTRMLTLLRLKGAQGLPVPTAAKKADLKIGQTAVAVGRTLTGIDQAPSFSVGIVSALNRIWGKMVQTDAKISPVNYGGPLVDLSGDIIGVLVPADPRADGETAGVGWYDSGIGFAVPMEDVFAAAGRLKQGKDLKRGLLGVNIQGGDEMATAPTITGVSPGSGAEKAGLKTGDKIVAIDGKAVETVGQMKHALGPKYEGDSVALKVVRDGKPVDVPQVVMAGSVATFGPAFLGILPMRDDPTAGVEVRYVYPKSPADAAGLKAGDRIVQIGVSQPGTPESWQALKGRDALLELIDGARPGVELKLEVVRKEGKKKEELKVKLGDPTEAVPEKLPEPATLRQGKPEKKEEKEDDKKAQVGQLKKTTAAADHSYWVYVPENYNKNAEVAHAVVIWLHPLNKNKEKDFDDFIDAWWRYCENNHIILVVPKAEGETGWTPGEADFVREATKFVTENYNVDKRRIVAHGMGQGGQMALYLGFNARNLIRGVATVGAALSGSPKERVANQPLSFYLVAGEKDPLRGPIKDSKEKLSAAKHPAVYVELKDMGHQYFDRATLDELVRWIDSLDRM